MSFYASLQTRIANWSKRRHGIDASPLTIHSRRVYILPTGLGLIFAVAVIAMGLGGMNYGNNLALLLAFLLASLGFVAMHHCQRNLVGLTIHALNNPPVFAGQPALVQLRIEHSHAEAHVELQAEADIVTRDINEHIQTEPTHVAAHAHAILSLSVPSTRRGWLRLPRLVVSTRYPFGLFRAWTVLHLPLQCLIYPRPSDSSITPPPLAYDSRRSQDLQRGDDDFAGFRAWQAGDPPQRIAWKLYARGQGLQVQQHAGATVSTLLFDWQALQGFAVEARLSRLTRWIVDADRLGVAYGLRLPGFEVPPRSGEAHLHRCLTALALFQGAEP